MNAQVIALVNQKGGVGKTTSCVNLGVGLAQAGKKVLVIDCDPQSSLSISLGHSKPDTLPVTLSDMMGKVLNDQPIAPGEGILHHAEGVDLMPSDIQLSGMEVSLVNAMSRETVLRQYLDTVRKQYTHILLDCQPSLGMLTVNALAAANRLIVPVQAEYLPAKGLEQLLQTVGKVRRQLNPKLLIDGILLTMVDSRTNFAKEISALLRETYGSDIKVFQSEIPHSVRAKETSAEGKSIFAYDPGGKVAEAYGNLTREVLQLEKQRAKNRAGLQKMVDDKKIAVTPAAEISYLKPEEQALLVETIESEQATPSLSQAQRMKKLSQSGELNEDTMLGIMSEEKKPEVDKIIFTSDTLQKYFPRSYTPNQPIMGHDLLAVERFRDDTRHMAEFSILADCSLGHEGQYLRRFLNEDGYAQVLDAQRQGQVRVYKYAAVIEGHIMPPKPKRRRGK